MNLLERQWHKMEGALPQVIARLRDLLPATVPEGYFRLLEMSNGGEGPLARQPLWLVLDPAETIIETVTARVHEEFFEGLLMFGSNGAGEFVAFDMRKPTPWPIVAIDMTNIDLAESVRLIAPNFDSFLDLIGVESD